MNKNKISIFTYLVLIFLAASSYGKTEKYLADGHVRVESRPVRVGDLYGLKEADGVTFKSGVRAYKGLLEGVSEIIVINKNGESVSWASDTGLAHGSYFRVVSVDFYGTNHFVPVVINHIDSSNGLGVDDDEVAILDKIGSNNPLFFHVDNYGDDIFQFNKIKKRIEILAGEWTQGEGSGTYYFGKWFYYENGNLYPDLEKTIIERRYTDGFANQRDEGNLPYHWLKKGKIIECKEDPAALFIIFNQRKTSTESQEVIIKDVKIDRKDGYFNTTVQLSIKNEIKDFDYHIPNWADDKNPDIFIGRLGDANSKRLFPAGYLPSTFENLIGKSGILETMHNDFQGYKDKETVLWF